MARRQLLSALDSWLAANYHRQKPRAHRLIFKYTFADADECSASLPVCDVNATCQNTPKSYICVCNSGLTGTGRTCTGKGIVHAYAALKFRNGLSNKIDFIYFRVLDDNKCRTNEV